MLVIARPGLAESFYIEGDGGVPIAVRTAGPNDAPVILFLHGIGMGADSFELQLNSNLADRFRLIAIDLRGHGMSGKPSNPSAYTDTRVWAGDVERVIDATAENRQVVVVAWSYGTLVASDYIRHMGTDRLAGLMLVGSTGGLVAYEPPSTPPDPEVLAELERSRALRRVPSFAAQEEATGIVAPMLTHCSVDPEWMRKAKILGLMVPPYAQGPLRAHPLDNSDLIGSLQELPVLVAYGAFDPSVPQSSADAMMASLPLSSAHRFENAGHAPFAEAPAAFSQLLADFANRSFGDSDDQ